MITLKKGNIFTTQCQAIVNTVNCVGVMGAGIAFEFKLRNPTMFERYQELCKIKEIAIGKLWIYTLKEDDMPMGYQQILNFPTKQDWKLPSRESYLKHGLQKLLDTYKSKGITSIAFPMLGADKGGLPPQQSMKIMQHYLQQCDIDIEIWQFDPTAKDDLYDRFKALMLTWGDEQIKQQSGLRIDYIVKLRNALHQENINSLSGLLRVPGIGEKTIIKLFKLMQQNQPVQQTLL